MRILIYCYYIFNDELHNLWGSSYNLNWQINHRHAKTDNINLEINRQSSSGTSPYINLISCFMNLFHAVQELWDSLKYLQRNMSRKDTMYLVNQESYFCNSCPPHRIVIIKPLWSFMYLSHRSKNYNQKRKIHYGHPKGRYQINKQSESCHKFSRHSVNPFFRLHESVPCSLRTMNWDA